TARHSTSMESGRGRLPAGRGPTRETQRPLPLGGWQQETTPPMQMTGEQRIEAPIEVVWAALNDPDVLRACIPGCQSLEVIGENRLRASATIKVGPISGRS